MSVPYVDRSFDICVLDAPNLTCLHTLAFLLLLHNHFLCKSVIVCVMASEIAVSENGLIVVAPPVAKAGGLADEFTGVRDDVGVCVGIQYMCIYMYASV